MPDEEVNQNAVRVLIVASYAAARAGLHALLRAEAEKGLPLAVLGEVEGSSALARLVPDERPHVLIYDTTGDESKSHLARLLDTLCGGETGLVVLGDAPTEDVPRIANTTLPGWGYLLRRESDGAQIASAVLAAASGLVTVDRSIHVVPAPPTVNRPTGVTPNLRPLTPELPGEALTTREIEVLQKMAEGLPNKIIATRLGISLHTVKFHVAQILGKLDATSRTEAVTLGARRGYVIL